MKQFQLFYTSRNTFRPEFAAIRDACPDGKFMVQVFYDNARKAEAAELAALLDAEFPDICYFGCAVNAAIHEGMLSEHTIAVAVTVFEQPDTKIKVLQYAFTAGTQAQVCDDLLERVRENPWVKGIELLITVRQMSTTYFCDRLSEMDPSVQIFGGNAFNPNLDFMDVSVFSKGNGFLDAGVVFVLIGGEQLHIQTSFITGWKPLGAKLLITKAEKNRLYELGGEPAYAFYYRYLRIDNDEKFYKNTLEFPISYERNGVSILRVPSGCMEDGSLLMSSDMIEGSMAQLTYGDPQTILRSLFHEAEKLADFVPEGILIFDCGSRRSFWGSEDIDRESLPFQTIANTAGFYTGGEFHRMGSSLNQHNVTLVIVGMREGEPGVSRRQKLYEEFNYENEHVSMVRRLANFIDIASNELVNANQQLSDANQQLMTMAITDELTGVYNRRAIQERIARAGQGREYGFSLIMLDLDKFKRINDTYGHDEGDNVLREFARILQECSANYKGHASAGRWGGEEFMILVRRADAQTAFGLAETIRERFAAVDFPCSGRHTVSCGVSEYHAGEQVEIVCSRVDDALYESKRSGRNRTTIV